MTQVIAATFTNGVFKPDQQPALSESTRVRLVVEPLQEDADGSRWRQAWADLEQLRRQSTFNSRGDRLSRDELHERR